MRELNTPDSERRETLDELSDLFVVAQEMGRRLGEETHGEAYGMVRDLNDLLHQARRQIDRIRADSAIRH